MPCCMMPSGSLEVSNVVMQEGFPKTLVRAEQTPSKQPVCFHNAGSMSVRRYQNLPASGKCTSECLHTVRALGNAVGLMGVGIPEKEPASSLLWVSHATYGGAARDPRIPASFLLSIVVGSVKRCGPLWPCSRSVRRPEPARRLSVGQATRFYRV